jgi:hypothetical protein
MHRRTWLAAIAALSLVTLPATLARAEEEITLKDRLNAGLRCRRPEEFAFVDTVIGLVDQKKLSREMVLGTYRWAAERRPDFPFYYFQYAIRERAKEIGVSVQ